MIIDLTPFPWAESVLSVNAPDYTADSLALSRRRRSRGVHRFELELVTVPISEPVMRELSGLINGGQLEKFTFIHPIHGYTAGQEPAGGLTLAAPVAAGQRSVSVTGTGSWQLKAGDLLQLIGGQKCYEVATSTALATGVQQVRLSSPVRFPAPVGEGVRVNGVTLHLIPDGTIDKETISPRGRRAELTAKFVEEV